MHTFRPLSGFSKLIYSLSLALIALPLKAQLPEDLSPELLDWHLFNPTERQTQACSGYYLAPELDLPEAHLSTDDARLFADAKQFNYSAAGGLQLLGDARLRKGALYVTADQANLNSSRDQANLEGNLVIRQEGFLLRGKQGFYNLNTKHLKLNSAHYVIHPTQIRGQAWQLEQEPSGIVNLRSSSLTSCAPNDNSWRLVADRLKLNQETGFGDATHVRLQIHKVPVFYWPWLRFPIDDRSHTGLLAPSISWSKTKGLDYLQPIYLNLAPNYDVTFYPRQIDKRGFSMGSEVRYLTQSHAGQLYYAHLNSDKDFGQLNRWHLAAEHQGQLSANLNFNLDFSQVSDHLYLRQLNSSGFDQADNELLQKLEFNYANQGWNTRLSFHGYLRLDDSTTRNDPPENNFRAFDLRKGRKASEQDYFRLPQLEVSKNWQLTEDWRSRLLIDATYFSKLTDSSLDGNTTSSSQSLAAWAPDAWRLHLEPSLSGNLIWPWAYVRPEAKLRMNYYDIQPTWDNNLTNNAKQAIELNPTAAVPLLSVDSGLFIERDANLFGNSYLQTLEPRLFLAYVPYIEQNATPNFFDGGIIEEDFGQLFRAERTSGRDRLGDVQKATLGLTQRLINADNGRELASFSIAKAFYLDDRYVDKNSAQHPKNMAANDRAYEDVRKSSNLGLQGTLNLNQNLRLTSTLMWDDYFKKTSSSNTRLVYTGIPNSQLSVGHSYTSNYLNLEFKGARPDKNELDKWSYLKNAEEQFYASLVYSLNANWRFFVKQSHDLKRGEKLDSLTGVEYNSCCWQLQFVYRDWVDNPDSSPNYDANLQTHFATRERDYGFFVNFVFKGLGGVGQDLPKLLEQEIQGYTSRP